MLLIPYHVGRKVYCSRSCYVKDIKHTPETATAAFWAKVDRSGGPDACWTWQGAVTAKWGYGCFNWLGRILGAHKVSWLITNGDPGELCVLHKCDNRLCVNPNHFFLGTKQDNANDAVAKGRQARGRMTGKSKLSDDIVRAIRAEYVKVHPKKGNGRVLAAKYGVSPAAVIAIASGRTWRHLK